MAHPDHPAGRLIDNLISSGTLSPAILDTHPPTADRVRALFALAARGLPDDAPVEVPGMAQALARMRPEELEGVRGCSAARGTPTAGARVSVEPCVTSTSRISRRPPAGFGGRWSSSPSRRPRATRPSTSGRPSWRTAPPDPLRRPNNPETFRVLAHRLRRAPARRAARSAGCCPARWPPGRGDTFESCGARPPGHAALRRGDLEQRPPPMNTTDRARAHPAPRFSRAAPAIVSSR